MSNIVFMRGLPGSGKSTYAKDLVKMDSNYGRVNRDDLRKMILCDKPWNKNNEKIISEVEKNTVKTFLDNHLNVVIDNTHLNIDRILDSWKDVIENHTVSVMFMDVPLNECIERDSMRAKPVGRHVIENMALNNNLSDFSEFNKWIILDLDGTIANIDHRLHHVRDGNKDWKSFFEKCHLDTVREDVRKQVDEYINRGTGVIILSGRPLDRCGKATVEWLRSNDIVYDRLFMRNAGDSRSDDIIKEEILDKILTYININDIEVAFDDRQRVIRVWKRRGIKVIECGDGSEY